MLQQPQRGLACYFAAALAICGEPGDVAAVDYWGGMIYFLALPTVYVPTLALVEARLGGTRPGALFPLAGAGVGILPLLLFGFMWNARSFRPELILFAVLFGATGGLLGLSYLAIRRTMIAASAT